MRLSWIIIVAVYFVCKCTFWYLYVTCLSQISLLYVVLVFVDLSQISLLYVVLVFIFSVVFLCLTSSITSCLSIAEWLEANISDSTIQCFFQKKILRIVIMLLVIIWKKMNAFPTILIFKIRWIYISRYFSFVRLQKAQTLIQWHTIQCYVISRVTKIAEFLADRGWKRVPVELHYG